MKTMMISLKNLQMKSMLVLGSLLLLVAPVAQALDIQSWTTSNGVKVLFVESHDLPMIDVRLAFKAGSSRDGEQHGVSSLVNSLLVEGSGKLSTEDIAQGFESVGAELGHSSLRDMAWLSLRSLSEPALWEPVVDLFAQVAALPSFPQDAIERDRQSMLINLANRNKQIANVAQDAFFEHLYPDHAYQIGQYGTRTALESLTSEDLSRFHSSYYVARNASLALVGDLTLTQAKAYAERLTRHLKPGQPAEVIQPVAVADKGKTVNIPFKTTQSHIVQGLPVLSRKDDDYFPLYLGNHVLGGSGFSSRLMQEIRENRGLSYSVYSYFIPMETTGPFQMALETSNHQVEEAAQLLQQMLVDFIHEGPTEKELEHSKKNITGGFALKIDSNKKIIEYLALIGFYDLPLDYLDRFNDNIMAVTRADIKDAFDRRVRPEQIIRVIVGESP